VRKLGEVDRAVGDSGFELVVFLYQLLFCFTQKKKERIIKFKEQQTWGFLSLYYLQYYYYYTHTIQVVLL